MEKTKNVMGFALKKIRTEQFAIVDESITLNPTINVNTNLSFQVIKKDRIIGVLANFKFEQENMPVMIINVSCHFEITEDSWSTFSSQESTKIVVPKGFMCHLTMLTVGTTRGVLHAKTEGTRFNQIILPTINLTEIIKEDITFND